MLRLTTFGGVGLRSDSAGGSLDAAERIQRRGLALLALLAAAPDAGVSRDTVAAYLWPESDQERARNALRQALFSLRRDLECPDLLTGGLALRLNSAVLSSDVHDFEVARLVGDQERAVALYSGPFLEGFHVSGVPEFERWVDRQRAEYAGRTAAALEALARGAGVRGDAAAAAEWWRRSSLMDPLNTGVVVELMTALATVGNAAGALRHAQVHEALVREELGAAPDPALGALVARIRDGSIVRLHAESTAPPSPSSTGAAGSSRSESHPQDASPSTSRPSGGHSAFLLRLEGALAGRYAFEGAPEVGRDGSARLIRARDVRHDRPVTLKVVHPALASVLDVERFLREIKLTARLQHPHILPLFDSGEVDGRPWYAMARPPGEMLRSRLARDGSLAAPEAMQVARELADALEHAHANGVLHRDVTPENVLLSGGHAILTNLGVAWALDAAGGPRLTETGILVGTPAYMSPEQAVGEGALDRRTDVYALGCVLFEMLTGEPVFSGPTPQAIMAKRASGPAMSPARIEALPSGLGHVVAKALAARPDQRFPSAAAFAAALTGTDGSSGREAERWRGWLGLGS
jgi:DNA-binding SARP family transcriptional activator